MKTLYFFISSLTLICNVYAQPGSLNTTFGTNGIAIYQVGTALDEANGMTIQADGKILLIGPVSNGANNDFGMIRLLADGTLDTSFGTSGKVITTVGSNANDTPTSIALQTDGKIVVAGYTTANTAIALLRYNMNGSLDTSFDADGKVTTNLSTGADRGEGLAIQADGKIVVGGFTSNGTDNDFVVLRYNTDGSLDTSFDTDGIVLTNIIGDDIGEALILQTDGKIVLVGTSTPATNNLDFTVVRYNTNGSLDTSFDTDGIKVISLVAGTNGERPSSVALQTDGKIIMAGYARVGSTDDFAVVRLNTDGSLDTSFDTDGITTTPIGTAGEQAFGVAVQNNGKIAVGGYSSNGTNNDFALVRYNTNGSLDTSFDADGKVTTNINGNTDRANAVLISSNGNILLAGYNDNGTDNDFAIMSYQGDTPVPLAVHYLSFTANRLNPNEVLLEWQTSTEQDNLGFEIQMGFNAINFQAIAFADGRGNSNQITNYKHQIASTETAYFRLKQINTDGSFEYSTTIFIPNDSKKTTINIHPNPASDKIYLTFTPQIEREDKIHLSITDLSGKILFETSNTNEEIANDLNHRFKALNIGYYLLKVRVKTSHFIHKIIKY